MTLSKNLCCLCCTSGPISALLSLPRRGYVPGDIVPVAVEIENLSSRKIESASITLKMVISVENHRYEKNEKVFILLFNQIRREYPKRLLLTNSYKFHFPLTQTTNFHSRDESRTVSTQIDKITHGAMPRGSTSAWTGEGIPLPALPPSFLFGCNIIDIQYKLEVLRYVHVLENF